MCVFIQGLLFYAFELAHSFNGFLVGGLFLSDVFVRDPCNVLGY